MMFDLYCSLIFNINHDYKVIAIFRKLVNVNHSGKFDSLTESEPRKESGVIHHPNCSFKMLLHSIVHEGSFAIANVIGTPLMSFDFDTCSYTSV